MTKKYKYKYIHEKVTSNNIFRSSIPADAVFASDVTDGPPRRRD